MAYIERSFGRSEILLHRAWSAMIVFLSLSAAAYAYELRWLAAVAALAGLALFLVFMVPVWSTEIGVTKQRFIFKTDLLRWSSDELLNYGRIEVRGTVWRTAKKLELQESWQLSQSAWSRHALSATFFCGDRWRPLRTAGQMGGAHGVGTYPGLHQRDRGSGAAAAE